MHSAKEPELEPAQVRLAELPFAAAHGAQGHEVPEVLEGEGNAVVFLVVRGAAPKGHGPDDLAEFVGDDHRGLPLDAVAVDEHDFLEAADVVGVAMGDQVISDRAYRETEEGEGFRRSGAAIDQEVLFSP